MTSILFIGLKSTIYQWRASQLEWQRIAIEQNKDTVRMFCLNFQAADDATTMQGCLEQF